MKLTQTLAHSHLAIISSISENREEVAVFFRSEPVVMEAASFLMRQKGVVHALLTHFFRNVEAGVVDIGQIGEVTSPLLCCLARDALVSNGQILLRSPVTFSAFLSALTGVEVKEGSSAPGRKPRYEVNSAPLPKELLDADVSFSHFASFGPVACQQLQVEDLGPLFEHGAALTFRMSNQEAVDSAIILKLPSGEFGLCLLQIKNYRDPIGPAAMQAVVKAMKPSIVISRLSLKSGPS